MNGVKGDFEDIDILTAKSEVGKDGKIYIVLEVNNYDEVLTIEKPELMALLTLINQKEEQIKTKLKREAK